MIRVADQVVDLGLGAGEQGGRIIYCGIGGRPAARSAVADREVPARRAGDSGARGRGDARASSGCGSRGASEHNLKDIDVEIPLGLFTCVTGVSGSGKSTLVHDVIYAAVKRAKGDWDRRVGAHRQLEGAEFVSDAVLVDQQPIGRTPRSNPGDLPQGVRSDSRAVCGDEGRPHARTHRQPLLVQRARRPVRGVRRRRASSASRCSSSPTSSCPCEQCDGKRFRPQVLEVRLQGPEHRPGARPDGARGADVLRRRAEGRAAPAGARRNRSRLSPARPAGDDAVGRGGAADQDRLAPRIAERRAYALRARRADDRPPLRRHRQAARRVPEAAGRRAQPARHRAQPRRAEDGGLDHRSRAGRRRGRRSRSSRSGRPSRLPTSRRRTPGNICKRALAAGRDHAFVDRR